MSISTTSVDTNALQAIFDAHKAFEQQAAAETAQDRRKLLKRLRDKLLQHLPALQEAVRQDLGKHDVETDITEISLVLAEIKAAMQELPYWMQKQRTANSLATLGTKSYTIPQPKGTVLILAPWNYPIQLTLAPLVGAIAAGNCVVLKPSELTPATSAAIANLLQDTFEQKRVSVCLGDASMSQALLQLPFNHIFFTGSPRVGKIVMAAAAQHLASVTLELGGKSPTIVDETAHIKDAAAKLFTKWINAGQICIAPDYLYVHENVHDALVQQLVDLLAKTYGAHGEQSATSASYCRIISQQHAQRQSALLQDALDKGAKIAFGGQHDAAARWMSPTLLTHVNDEMLVMQEEIFGPLLPIIPFKDLSEPIAHINRGEKPLALYIFSKSKRNQQRILNETRAGGTCINDAMLHILNHHLPFGGANNSGIGQYHGEYSFRAFSENRSVVHQQTLFHALRFLYPPYGPLQRRITNLYLWLLR